MALGMVRIIVGPRRPLNKFCLDTAEAVLLPWRQATVCACLQAEHIPNLNEIMANELNLRMASSSEAASLSRLMIETFVAAYGDVAPADRLQRHIAKSYDARQIADRIDGGDIEIWVVDASAGASAAPRDAGYLQLGLKVAPPAPLAGRPALEVQRCYMRPEYIGSGGAHSLMTQAQQRARELGAPALHLSVYQLAPRAVNFYKRHGFRQAAAIKYYIDDVEFDDWLMVWEG